MQDGRIVRGEGTANLIPGREGEELHSSHHALVRIGVGAEKPAPVGLEPLGESPAEGVEPRRRDVRSAARRAGTVARPAGLDGGLRCLW